MAKVEMKRKYRDAWSSTLDAMPKPRPVSATWEGKDNVLMVLAPFATCGANHFLLPAGGGMDIASVRQSQEEGCIELVVSKRSVYVVRPKRVTLEHFPDAPLETFLLVELGELEPTGIYDALSRPTEEVVEVNGEYVERYHWDDGTLGEDENGEPLPLPANAHLVVRWMRGKIMVVSKGSIWNGISATYDGRHSRMESAEIRRQIAAVLERIGPDYLQERAEMESQLRRP